MVNGNGQNGHAQVPQVGPPPPKPTPMKGQVGEYMIMGADGGFVSEPLAKIDDARVHAKGAAAVRGENRPDLAEVPVWILQLVEIYVPRPLEEGEARSVPVE